ncbi:type II CRISPR RNA-guided endonuclease Cas9 [soil metagenome]
MKKILGLDIGTTSIGWAIVEAVDEKKINVKTNETANSDINNDRIAIHKGNDDKHAVGVRIIPQDSDNIRSFTEGKKLNTKKTKTPTKKRREKRGIRRLNNRYKMRREKLLKVLELLQMLPVGAVHRRKNEEDKWEEIRSNSEFYSNAKGKRGSNNDIGKAIYELRDRAVREKIELTEWGRIILHLNQLRGYSSDRFKKDEVEKFEYISGIVIESSEKPLLIKYDDDTESTELVKEKADIVRWNKYRVKIKLDEPLTKIDEEDNQTSIEFIEGNVYEPEARFLIGNPVTFKYEVSKSNETKIKFVKPDQEDWKSKYKIFNQTMEEWCNNGGTVGSYFYQNYYLRKNIERIRNHVVNRDWYETEFNKIFDFQFEKHKKHFSKFNIEDLTSTAFKDIRIFNEVKKKESINAQIKFLIKDKLIYFQRPWQQNKNKGRCTFEKVPDSKKAGNHIGRTVIPRSHLLHQEFKIWQQINNLRIWFHSKDAKPIELLENSEKCNLYLGKTPSEIKELFYCELQVKKERSWRTFVNDTFKDRNIDLRINFGEKRKTNSNSEYFSVNYIKRTKGGKEQDNKLKGNTTLIAIKEIIGDKVTDEWYRSIHLTTPVSNLQLLWELIYDTSIPNPKKVEDHIEKHFPLLSEKAEELSKLKFDDSGMANLSAKAIRNILPLMKDGIYWNVSSFTEKCNNKINSLISLNDSKEEKNEKDEKLRALINFIPDKNTRIKLSKYSTKVEFKGLNYWEASAVIYGSHSTKKVTRVEKLERISPQSMNNPIVEKVVNETLMLVNALKVRYGFDEVRIELSRDLKASSDEREKMWDSMQNNEIKIERAKGMLRELKKGDAHCSLNLDINNKNNLDKIKIIEDVVAKLKGKEYEDIKKEYKINEPSNAELKKYLLYLDQNFKCPYTFQPIPLSDIFSRTKRVEIEHIIPRERYADNSYGNKVITWVEVNSLKKELGNRTAYEFIVSKRGQDEITLFSGRKVNLVKAENWDNHVKEMFPKGRKQRNLLLKEIPEDPIARQLKDTQYINKKLKEELEKLCPEHVWTTTGSVTDILRERWHLNEVMKELMRERFEKFKVTLSKNNFEFHSLVQPAKVDTETGELTSEKFAGYSKRLDHRHHALDAVIVACTKQFHIQYLNLLNQINSVDQESESDKKQKYAEIKKNVCVGKSSNKFLSPWDENEFLSEIQIALKNVIISHKNVRLLISPSKHRNGKQFKEKKVVSLRGELHKETNYAKKNYFQGKEGRTEIRKVIKEILERKLDNQNQSMTRVRSFADLIKAYVFKEKHQIDLIHVFQKYDDIILNNSKKSYDENSLDSIGEKILKQIVEEKLLFNLNENKPLVWLSTFSEKNSAARPNGLEMDLNKLDEIEKIADARLKRLARYRLNYVNSQLSQIDKEKLDNKEKDLAKSLIKAIPLFSNAIYEVRVKREDYDQKLKTHENPYEWIELKDLKLGSSELISKIEYPNAKQTKAIKEKLIGILKKNNDFGDYFKNPLFISNAPIPVKKVRKLFKTKDLFEIRTKVFVEAIDSFMAYIFVPKKNATSEINKHLKRRVEVLKFIEAINIINNEKPDKIKYSELFPLKDIVNYELAFTLAKRDLVFLPEKAISEEEINLIDWDDNALISERLFIVKDISPSRSEVFKFQKHLHASTITINDEDAKSIFNNPDLKSQFELYEIGNVAYTNNCIKVYIDKLGKKIVPYWKFPNGSWNNEIARKLGLL